MVRRLLVKETIAGSIPAAAAGNGRASRWATAAVPKTAERRALRVRLPLLPLLCPWPSGKGAGLPNQIGGFDSHRALSGIG